MNFVKNLCRISTLVVILTMSASGGAMPITFEFSGTVTVAPRAL